jgi:regulator of protease activity HflC (stomatin/prohibitin superfamily)
VNALGDLLKQLLDHVFMLWPLAVLAPWERGAKIRLGQVVQECTPHNGIRGSGLHWVWPFVEVMYTQESNVELFGTRPQTIDGITFEFVGQCQLTNAGDFYTAVNDDLVTVVGNIVAASASDVLEKHGRETDEKFKRRALALARKRIRGWGIRIAWIALRDVTESPTLRLITSH